MTTWSGSGWDRGCWTDDGFRCMSTRPGHRFAQRLRRPLRMRATIVSPRSTIASASSRT
jgi:nicotinamide riboside kinase